MPGGDGTGPRGKGQGSGKGRRGCNSPQQSRRNSRSNGSNGPDATSDRNRKKGMRKGTGSKNMM